MAAPTERTRELETLLARIRNAGMVQLNYDMWDPALDRWRAEIDATVARDGPFIRTVLPAIERVLGPQPPPPVLKTGLVFPSEAGTRPAGNDQINDVWREVQVMAGIDRPVTVHGIRHSFHDLARQQGVPDAVVKAMAGRAGTDVAARGQDKHLHYSRGVTVEAMRQASIALMQLVPTEPTEVQKGRDLGRDGRGRDRKSDEEQAAATAS